MTSGGRKRNKSIRLTEKKRERHRVALVSGGRRVLLPVDIENGYFRMEKFEDDRREFKSLEVRTGR